MNALGISVGVIFAIIAVCGAAVFKFRHQLATMVRKDGGATKPGSVVTMNTQYEPNLAGGLGILNAVALNPFPSTIGIQKFQTLHLYCLTNHTAVAF